MVIIDETIEKRVAYLGDIYGTKDVANKRVVNLWVTHTLPIIDTTPELITDRTLSTNPGAAVDTTKFPNVLVGITKTLDATTGDVTIGTDTARFTFIASVKSTFNNAVQIYYDNKFKDIIIIPDTSLLGSGSTTDAHANQEFTLRCYRVGGGMNIDNTGGDLVMPPNAEGVPLPVCNENIAINNDLLMLDGMNRVPGSQPTTTSINNVWMSTGKRTPMTYLTIGDPAILFETVSNVPLFTMYQVNVDQFAVKYVGNRKPTHIIIPLNF